MPFYKQREPRVYSFAQTKLIIEDGVFWADESYPKSFLTLRITTIHGPFIMSTLIVKKHPQFPEIFKQLIENHKEKLRAAQNAKRTV